MSWEIFKGLQHLAGSVVKMGGSQLEKIWDGKQFKVGGFERCELRGKKYEKREL